jgi:hypothetical protein
VTELARRGPKFDYHTVWSFVHAEGLSFQKVSAGEQNRRDIARLPAQWRIYQRLIDPDRLVFIDEASVKTNMAPLRCWALARHETAHQCPIRPSEHDSVHRSTAARPHRGTLAARSPDQCRAVLGSTSKRCSFRHYGQATSVTDPTQERLTFSEISGRSRPRTSPPNGETHDGHPHAGRPAQFMLNASPPSLTGPAQKVSVADLGGAFQKTTAGAPLLADV